MKKKPMDSSPLTSTNESVKRSSTITFLCLLTWLTAFAFCTFAFEDIAEMTFTQQFELANFVAAIPNILIATYLTVSGINLWRMKVLGVKMMITFGLTSAIYWVALGIRNGLFIYFSTSLMMLGLSAIYYFVIWPEFTR